MRRVPFVAALLMVLAAFPAHAQIRWREIWRDPGTLGGAYPYTIGAPLVAGDHVAVPVLRKVPWDHFYSLQYWRVRPGAPVEIAGAGKFFLSSDDPTTFVFDINPLGHFLGAGLTSVGSGSTASIVTGPIGGGEFLINPATGEPFEIPATYDFQFRDAILRDDGVIAVKDAATGIWVGTPDNMQLLAPNGAPVPGTDLVLRGLLNPGESSGLRLNDRDQIAFFSRVRGPGGFLGAGLFLASPDGITMVAGPGDAMIVNDWIFSSDSRLLLGNNGRVALGAFVFDAGERYPVALPGTPAPGTDGALYAADRPSLRMSPSGQVAYLVHLTGDAVTPSNDLAIYTGMPGAERLRLRSGEEIPGFSDVFFASFIPRAYNDTDQLLIHASLVGAGVDSNNDVAQFIIDADNSLHLVFREGIPIDLGNGQTHTRTNLQPLQLRYADFRDEWPNSFDELGRFYRVFDIDGIPTLFEATLVPDSATALVPLLLLPLLRYRRCSALPGRMG